MVGPKYKSRSACPASSTISSSIFPALCITIYRDSSNVACMRIGASIQPRFEYLARIRKTCNVIAWA